MAQQENAPNKPVHLIYLCGAVVLFYITQWSIDWICGYFFTPPSQRTAALIAAAFTLIVSIVLYRSDRVHGLAIEVTSELKKVTWSSAKEVRAATIIVIVMALISALILFGFDAMWSQLTELIYGG